MKKFLSFFLALGLCFSLCVPALAHDTGTVNITTTISTHVCSYGGRTMAVKSDGSLWMWGGFVSPYIDKKYGSMDPSYESRPVKIMTDVVSVSCTGTEHCAAIKKDGSLWMWGLNNEGQLGNGGQGDTVFNGQTYQFSPTKVMDNVAAVSCGFGHTAVIKTDGSLWLWGNNRVAQIGNGYTGDASRTEMDPNGYIYPIQTTPQKIMDDIVAVSCGDDFTAAIKKDGTLWTWGLNKYGQLGNGGRGDSTTISRRKVEIGKVQTVPAKIMDDVISVSCGGTHAAAIKKDGSLWVWGQNGAGCLGVGSTSAAEKDGYNSDVPIKIMDSVASVACGVDTTAAIKTDGSLWMWGLIYNGDNISQQVGSPTKILDGCLSVSTIGPTTFVIKNDGSLYGWGRVETLGTGKGVGNSANNAVQTTPVKILDGMALPSGTTPVVVPDVPSSWSKNEVEAAIAAKLVPENLQKNYTKPVSRGDVAQMFINLIEKSSGKTVESIIAEKGAEINASAFTDTSDKAVLAANALGIINGVGDGKFNPSGTFTRAQIAAIINRTARVLGVDTDGYTHSFTDVKGHWSDSELGWPSNVGIINGVGNNKFSPDTQLTTEQAIAITYRALQVLKK